MAILKTLNRIINGTSFNIQSAGNNVVINGESISVGEFSGINIIITIEGDCEEVSLGAGNITVNGGCGKLKTGAGDINVKGNVGGNVDTSCGDISVGGNVDGNVKTACGDIDIKNVSGNITM